MNSQTPNYFNEFTQEYWRGHADRTTAPDYITRVSFAFTNGRILYTGRLNGEPCDDQSRLAAARAEIMRAVWSPPSTLDVES